LEFKEETEEEGGWWNGGGVGGGGFSFLHSFPFSLSLLLPRSLSLPSPLSSLFLLLSVSFFFSFSILLYSLPSVGENMRKIDQNTKKKTKMIRMVDRIKMRRKPSLLRETMNKNIK
jgi:hypothetical protein